MDPSTTFCPNAACPDKGQQGRGNIGIHSWKERRYRCKTCRGTFAATRGTAFYRVHHPVELLVLVVTLLSHGCPPQAIVAAFGLDERTVAAWLHRTGAHAARGHAATVETGQVDLGQVQADEICVKVCKGRIWQAMALAVPSRLWLGGDLSPARDGALVTATLRRVAACAWSCRRRSCWHRWSRATKGGAWWTSRGAWSSARRRRSRTPSRPKGGTQIMMDPFVKTLGRGNLRWRHLLSPAGQRGCVNR